jgi:peptidoglycan/xylan/chitin deacetylase (PgdA/CDA1 family)
MFDLTMTFDNGPTNATPQVLDLLGEHGAKATFFMVGEQLADPALRRHAERAVAEGHWIGNHTYTHTLTFGRFQDLEASVAEVSKTPEVIGDLSHPDRLIRPFADGGILGERVLNRRVFEYLKAKRFTVVFWNAIPRDWEGHWVDRALEQCVSHPWTLMVIHDRPNCARPGLKRFLPAVIAAGARFRQDFPPECVPMRRGQVERPMDHLIARQPVARTSPIDVAAPAGGTQ